MVYLLIMVGIHPTSFKLLILLAGDMVLSYFHFSFCFVNHEYPILVVGTFFTEQTSGGVDIRSTFCNLNYFLISGYIEYRGMADDILSVRCTCASLVDPGNPHRV